MDIRDSIHDLNNRETNDIAIALGETLCGEHLGKGHSRVVYDLYNSKTGKVVKISTDPAHIANTLEYSIWQDFKETKEAKKWLAACYFISSCGKILTQEKLKPITDINNPLLPTHIPRWITDRKIQNWGIDQDGNVKCCDYGVALLLQNGPWGLTKAEWWSL